MSDRIGNKITVPAVADALGEVFASAGHQLHLVGGSVRDAILRRKCVDLDFTTAARPETTVEIFKKHASTIWTTGADFGTIGGIFRGERVEVTTYRADTYDRVGRNPIVQYGDTLVDDLRRRDFTINAMAVSLPDHEFCDPFDGTADIARQVIRTPGTPEESFADDPLRMMRAARFTAQLGFDVEADVKNAMTNMSSDLARITSERIRDEFVKLMGGEDPVRGLRLLVTTGLAEQFLPELPALRMAIDEHAQHKDVYEHTLAVVRNAMSLEGDSPDTLLRITALLHDIGKPATKGTGPDGRVTFHHHEAVGARMAKKRLRTLRFSKDDVAEITHLIALHLRFYGYGRGEWTDSAVRRYVTDAEKSLPRLHKLVRSDVTTRNKRKATRLATDYDALEERIARIAEEEDLARVRPDLDGNDIMTLLKIPAGPLVGKAWQHLKEKRLELGPLSRQEAENELFAWARQQGLTDDTQRS